MEWSHLNDRKGMVWFEVITKIGICKMLQHARSTTSPISQSKVPLVRNSRAFINRSSAVP